MVRIVAPVPGVGDTGMKPSTRGAVEICPVSCDSTAQGQDYPRSNVSATVTSAPTAITRSPVSSSASERT